MAFRYNDGLDNPDYHDSETLELDRVRSRRSTSSHRNPYDSSPYYPYEDYNGEGRTSPVETPLDSVRIPSPAEYGSRPFPFETSDPNPYGNSHINPSFEYEPEFPYMSVNFQSIISDRYAYIP
uniref:Uncharacterized protein n=1 Tax=Sphaerodactylus townsendi TaxID=933632 RepID=A0ACB8FKU4_9SAUR